MSNWIDTMMDNVSVSWDADAKKAKISHRYEVDGRGEPVGRVDQREMERACEAALDTIDVHVLLSIGADADTGAGEEPDGWAEEVLMPKVDEAWAPTHKITFTPDGKPAHAPVFVMFIEENMAAYDRDEWRAEDSGAWYINRSNEAPNGPGWYCEGRVTPGGQNGVVEVEEIDPKPRAHCECGQALEDERCAGYLDTATPVVVRYIPEWLRESHEQAGYCSVTRVRAAAKTIRVLPGCVQNILDDSGEWAEVVEESDSASRWTLYEDNAGGLWGRPSGASVAYELEHGEPNRGGASIEREEYERAAIIAHMDGVAVVERVRKGGSGARGFFAAMRAS